jgi:hypothetical protein
MSRVRECGTKQAHDTKEAADRHAWALARAGARRSALKVYRCPHCGSWHVGHKRRRG